MMELVRSNKTHEDLDQSALQLPAVERLRRDLAATQRRRKRGEGDETQGEGAAATSHPRRVSPYPPAYHHGISSVSPPYHLGISFSNAAGEARKSWLDAEKEVT